MLLRHVDLLIRYHIPVKTNDSPLGVVLHHLGRFHGCEPRREGVDPLRDGGGVKDAGELVCCPHVAAQLLVRGRCAPAVEEAVAQMHQPVP